MKSALKPLPVLLLLLAGACAGPTSLSGTDLGGTPAPAFSLIDQTGTTVSLAGLRGRVVTVSFLYTSCPDICPLTAGKLAQAYQQLSGPEQQRTALVAITVDPERDTPDRRSAFARAHGLDGALAFLGADRTLLAPIWLAYGVAVERDASGSATAVSNTISHTAATYLIDQDGRERELLIDQDFTADRLAQDVRILLREQPGAGT